MNENGVDQHFHFPRNARKAFTTSESTKSMDSSDSIPD